MKDTFQFQDTFYQYVDASPNQTRVNERRAELPLALDYLDSFKGKSVLEVGNVLRHYIPKGQCTHDVVDLYEKNPNFPEIINEDILTWTPEKKYDTVISVSTVEHTDNPLLAVQRICSMAPHVFITIPFGYAKVNEIFDAYPQLAFIKRVNQDNDWREATREEVKDTQYNTPFQFANAIMILKI